MFLDRFDCASSMVIFITTHVLWIRTLDSTKSQLPILYWDRQTWGPQGQKPHICPGQDQLFRWACSKRKANVFCVFFHCVNSVLGISFSQTFRTSGLGRIFLQWPSHGSSFLGLHSAVQWSLSRCSPTRPWLGGWEWSGSLHYSTQTPRPLLPVASPSLLPPAMGT